MEVRNRASNAPLILPANLRGNAHGWAGCGAEPCVEQIAPQAPPIPERSVGPTRRGRVQSQEGAADQARGGIGCKPVSREAGAEGEACGQGGNAPGCKTLLALYAPGLTRSDQRAYREGLDGC
jgi:hypothetical protein